MCQHVYILSIGVMILMAIGCKKEAEHYVRIRNEFTEPLKEVKLDEINYGAIDSGATTGYKYVMQGSFPVSITTKSGIKATGSAQVKGGSGTEYWTVVVLANGGISTIKDN